MFWGTWKKWLHVNNNKEAGLLGKVWIGWFQIMNIGNILKIAKSDNRNHHCHRLQMACIGLELLLFMKPHPAVMVKTMVKRWDTYIPASTSLPGSTSIHLQWMAMVIFLVANESWVIRIIQTSIFKCIFFFRGAQTKTQSDGGERRHWNPENPGHESYTECGSECWSDGRRYWISEIHMSSRYLDQASLFMTIDDHEHWIVPCVISRRNIC